MNRNLITICLFFMSSTVLGQVADKSLQQTNRLNTDVRSQLNFYNSDWVLNEHTYADEYTYDLLKPGNQKHTYLEKQSDLYGQQVTFRMQFADWLSLRLGVYDDDNVQPNDLFLPITANQNAAKNNDMGYQLGISSVLDLSPNWRFGVDVSTGQIPGDLMGLYQDQLDTASFGLGVRNQRFGASLHSDYASSQHDGDVYRSSIDLQVDWHFNQDGTLSFGARKNMNDSTATNLDQFTGTVPYIKFKHNL